MLISEKSTAFRRNQNNYVCVKMSRNDTIFEAGCPWRCELSASVQEIAANDRA
jgi:hypothetical protein